MAPKGLPRHGKNRIFPHPPSSPSGKGCSPCPYKSQIQLRHNGSFATAERFAFDTKRHDAEKTAFPRELPPEG
ncbi:hypothetical protein RHEC894_CH03737 [Rhizobium sp. CIAT894]|nr:hypothetical protein RHEC894_CH03737 [Rhizobium sp. CIAT894]